MHTVKNLIFALQAAPIQPEGGEVSGGDWRFELRIRYLPNDWSEVYEKDNITFMCYYNQVKDYISIHAIDHTTQRGKIMSERNGILLP